jgi:hypothetical protein
MSRTRGVVYVHACVRAVCPHVEWAFSAELGRDVRLDWAPQPVHPGTVRAEYSWAGPAGTAARLASALRAFPDLRFEITEEASEGHEAERFSSTPELGIYRAATGPYGDVMIHEDRLRAALASSGDLRAELEKLLGADWDRDLEPYRMAGAYTSHSRLHNAI